MAGAEVSKSEVVGRDEELATVRGFLADIEGLPSALFVEGEAGIGKTTLWRAGAAAAEELGYVVLSTRPAEAESRISYAALGDLLGSVIERAVVELPSPQRRALEIALLLRDAGDRVPDQGAIAFAVLGAFRAIADTPVLVAVDDVQWLDGPSAFALRFAARRLRKERVGFLLSVRSGGGGGPVARELRGFLSEERTCRVHVGPLSLGALHHLLQTRLSVVLSRPTLWRVQEMSGGNPFFALELARALHQQSAPVPAGEPLPVPGELRELLRLRLAGLVRETEEPLLFAAAMPQPSVGVVGAAFGADPLPSLRRALAAEVIELEGERIRFAHPLFASVLYSGIDGDRRRDIHRRLAAVVTDPEERARHLALGTRGADAGVASALDDAARTVRSRGAPQAAAVLSELALRLTPDDDAEAAHRRRLDAGAAHFDAGDTGRALALFAEAVERAGFASERAAGLVRLAWVNHYAGDQRLAVELFRECLADTRTDVAVRIDAENGLANSLFFLREDLATAVRHARRAARLARERGDRATLAVILGDQGMIEAVHGRSQARRTLRAAVAIEDEALNVPAMRGPSFQLAVTSVWSDDLDAARAALQDVRQRAVAHGDESSLPFILSYLSLADCLAGRLEQAVRVADEGVEAAVMADQEIGRAFVVSARALAEACLGREQEARSDAGVALDLAKRGTMFAEMTSVWALGLLELALDNPAEAHKHLGPLVERIEATGVGEPGSIRFVTDDVEALVTLGELEHARVLVGRHEERARRLRRRSALAACARCRGLLAGAEGDFDGALASFGAALDSYLVLSLPLETARTVLALGSVQRRAKQRAAARHSLERAQAEFDGLGARLWSEKTRAELARIGGRAPSPDELTATEQRVAALVAAGRTNPEVAAELSLTVHTVEKALTRIYSKLGVRSRTELARKLAVKE
jgi:DNA-binding CsgD family transcriptional regulator